MNSPTGRLKLVANEKGLAALYRENNQPHHAPFSDSTEEPHHPLLLEAEKQLTEYFQKRRQEFSLPLNPSGTEFQKKVWTALSTIPFGETRSYGEVAKQIGNMKAARAVGAANGRNPILIVIPCHRVVGASGELTGFAGGLPAKKLLLNLERIPL